MRRFQRLAAIAFAVALGAAFPAQADIRIAQLDGLSGAFGNIGTQQRESLQASIDALNAAGGVKGEKFKLVSIDGKGNPQATLQAFREAVDDGIRIITQGNSSSVAAALEKAVDKYNRRHPDDPVLYLDHSAIDNALTGKDCSFWFFQFDASVAMKTRAIMTKLVADKSVHKIFLIDQDYSMGRQAAKDAKLDLAKLRPDVKVVGDVLHPIGQVKDFAPYVAQIAQSGADTVFTANWGNDLSLLVKAIKDAGLKVHVYTFYGSGYGAPAAMGSAAIGRVYSVSEWDQNIQPDPIAPFVNAYQKKTGHDWLFQRIRTMMFILDAAMKKADTTTNIKAIAYAMEGLHVDAGTGTAWVSKSNHQILQRLYILKAVKLADAGGPPDALIDSEHSGTAFVPDMVFAAQDTAVPSACHMKRP